MRARLLHAAERRGIAAVPAPSPSSRPGRARRGASSQKTGPASRSIQAVTPKRLIGIDPGTQLAGWGIVERDGTSLKLVACGALRGGGARTPMSERLRAIFEELETVLAEHRPQAAALEETFSGLNPKSAIAMGQGRGVAMLALARANLEVTNLSPNAIKKAVTGQGHAGKALVARMVCARLGLRETPEPEDVTDALAAAIALAHRVRVQ